MDNEPADPASTRIDEQEQQQEDAADRERREFAILLNEIEDRLADEAGYGHGV